ncbi:uncharacterized protein METZ01_LOCUS150690 [marine metagenome]|uniref:Uncharacterized protein n=1 Tax=marine metagenome TaxID=408172 RepID=A0A382A8F6_9ZZZZ
MAPSEVPAGTTTGTGSRGRGELSGVRRTARRLWSALVAVFLVAATLTATATPTSAESVSTGYKADGIVDLIWAAEHFGYSGPGEMQKAGVSSIKFFLGVAGITGNECDLGLADSLDPTGPYVYKSKWSDEELAALEWVADHYCITKEQAQVYGGTLFTFFAGLDAGENGTTAARRDPPPLTTTTTKPSGFPRVCQAWGGIQNRPDLSEVERLASHDFVFATPHVLELDWERTDDQPYEGLSVTLANIWEGDAVLRKASLLRLNPDFKFLASVFYREGPYVGDETDLTDLWDFGHFPPDSPFWFRDAAGEPVPAFGFDLNLDGVVQAAEIELALVDFRNPDLIELIAQKALALDQSGVVDGVMLDWWSEHGRTAASFIDWSTFYMTAEEEVEARLAILRRIRELVSDDFLIVGNTNQWTAPRSAPYMNGMYMETVKADWFSGYTVEELQTIEESLYWGSENLREPRINCLEGRRVVYDYGEVDDDALIAERDSAENKQWMRLFTTLSLTHSDEYVVFSGDPNHTQQHNWYDFWDADLGLPVGDKRQLLDGIEGLFIREFTNGYAVYNRSGTSQTISLSNDVTAVSSGLVAETHQLGDLDGEIYLGPTSETPAGTPSTSTAPTTTTT